MVQAAIHKDLRERNLKAMETRTEKVVVERVVPSGSSLLVEESLRPIPGGCARIKSILVLPFDWQAVGFVTAGPHLAESWSPDGYRRARLGLVLVIPEYVESVTVDDGEFIFELTNFGKLTCSNRYASESRRRDELVFEPDCGCLELKPGWLRGRESWHTQLQPNEFDPSLRCSEPPRVMSGGYSASLRRALLEEVDDAGNPTLLDFILGHEPVEELVPVG